MKLKMLMTVALLAMVTTRAVAQEVEPAPPPAVLAPAEVRGLPMIQIRAAEVNIQGGGFLRVPAPALGLNQLVPMKIDIRGDAPQLIMMIEGYRSEEREVTVMRVRQEKRTRIVVLPSGKEEEQVYTVSVPFTETVQQPVPVPIGAKPKALPLSQFRFFDLNSKEISAEDAAKILSSLKPAFLLEQLEGEPPPLAKYQRQVFKEDVLVVTTKEVVQAAGQQAYLPAPALQMPAVPR